jgi:hypothetical protein
VYAATVLVVDAEELPRKGLLVALQRLGLRALGVERAVDALLLLSALEADLALVCGDDDQRALASLRSRLPLIRLERGAKMEEAVVALLRALGRPEAAAQIN